MTESRVRIAASILTADFTCIAREMDALEAAGIDYFHVDVMDGQFVPAITLGPHILSGMRRCTRLMLDVHLMVMQPERQLEPFLAAGSDALTAHIEASADLTGFLRRLKDAGLRGGVSLNPETPVESVEPYLTLVDQVLMMTVHPGKGGQPFLESALPRIAQLRRLIASRGLAVDIAVDGGINERTAPRAVEAGAGILVVGTALLDHRSDLAAGVARIRAAISGASQPLGSTGAPGSL